MPSITEVVSLPEWQSLRASFVGTWEKNPSGNVARLRQFLAVCPGGHGRERRLRIVNNYLTGSAFRSGRVTHPEITALLTEVRAERQRREK